MMMFCVAGVIPRSDSSSAGMIGMYMKIRPRTATTIVARMARLAGVIPSKDGSLPRLTSAQNTPIAMRMIHPITIIVVRDNRLRLRLGGIGSCTCVCCIYTIPVIKNHERCKEYNTVQCTCTCVFVSCKKPMI